ncbi:DUF4942 domain-containing protein [Vibrio parahaemolyticus]|nr:DUF4942 domain-containing protein [Vibrio parahaemolyticus]
MNMPIAKYKQPTKNQTLAIVRSLKDNEQCFEWYPTSDAQLSIVTQDIIEILSTHDVTRRYNENINVLDVGAGDGRALKYIEKAITENESRQQCTLHAVEKASVHTATYRHKDITLIGTEFNECNFISKHCDIAFVNPPYSQFSHWIATLIMQLNFKVMYAVIPVRWQHDKAIQDAMKCRGITTAEVLDESDFLDAHRQARARVHIVRFAFNDFAIDNERIEKALQSESRRDWVCRPTLGRDATDPFQIFLDNELGLVQTHSATTNKFSEYAEKERIRRDLETEGSDSFEIVESRGVVWALLDNYEHDMAHLLSEYKKISSLDSSLLAELGVEYKALREGLQAKLLGFRSVYWSLLFDHLDVLKDRLTSANKTKLLNTLNANTLDFTHKNALYVIDFAVKMANELVETSLIEVFKELTSEESILRHYKSNERHYQDKWRHNHDNPNQHAKYVLDYRFISSHWNNFGSNSWEQGLNESARRFSDDILVALKLIGYDNFEMNQSYDEIKAGGKLVVTGTCPNGQRDELLHIRFFKNGNRHIQFQKSAMLRLNCVCSRLLGWVRSKAEFEQECECKQPISDSVWASGDKLKVLPQQVLALTFKTAI